MNALGQSPAERPSANSEAPLYQPHDHTKQTPHGAERRAHPRQDVFTAGVLFPEGKDEVEHRRSIFVFNVSCGGIGFRSQTCFEEGSRYEVRVGAGPLHLTGRIQIVSCRPRPDGTCDVGAKFT